MHRVVLPSLRTRPYGRSEISGYLARAVRGSSCTKAHRCRRGPLESRSLQIDEARTRGVRRWASTNLLSLPRLPTTCGWELCADGEYLSGGREGPRHDLRAICRRV